MEDLPQGQLSFWITLLHFLCWGGKANVGTPEEAAQYVHPSWCATHLVGTQLDGAAVHDLPP